MGWRGGVFGAVAASQADPVILCFETVRAGFDRAWAGGVGWWGLVGIGGPTLFKLDCFKKVP